MRQPSNPHVVKQLTNDLWWREFAIAVLAVVCVCLSVSVGVLGYQLWLSATATTPACAATIVNFGATNGSAINATVNNFAVPQLAFSTSPGVDGTVALGVTYVSNGVSTATAPVLYMSVFNSSRSGFDVKAIFSSTTGAMMFGDWEATSSTLGRVAFDMMNTGGRNSSLLFMQGDNVGPSLTPSLNVTAQEPWGQVTIQTASPNSQGVVNTATLEGVTLPYIAQTGLRLRVNGIESMLVMNNGWMSVGDLGGARPQATLHVQGPAIAQIFEDLSSKHLKSPGVPIPKEKVREVITGIEPVSFRYLKDMWRIVAGKQDHAHHAVAASDTAPRFEDELQYGFIADDVELVLPEAVRILPTNETQPVQYKTLVPNMLIPFVVAAVQDMLSECV